MGGDISSRFSSKESYNLLLVELQSDYGLSPIASRALVKRFRVFVDQFRNTGVFTRQSGQITFSAITHNEPAGKPLKYCRKKQVVLTLLSPEDHHVHLGSGSVELRRLRLCRLANEAFVQGGVLSQEDLSLLLGVDVSTIKHQSAFCRRSGFSVPTRGYVADIGSGTSHKERIITLYFRGKGLTEIALVTSHSLSSVERYLEDFARVVELISRELSASVIQRITGLSRGVVQDYLSLYQRYKNPDDQQYLDDLRRRFCCFDDGVLP